MARKNGGKEGRLLAHPGQVRSEEHTSELQSRQYLVCRHLIEKTYSYFSRNFPTRFAQILLIFAFSFTYHIYPPWAPPLTAPFVPPYTSILLHHIILASSTLVR